jgi:NADH-quinone oxidoreductase subunit M
MPGALISWLIWLPALGALVLVAVELTARAALGHKLAEPFWRLGTALTSVGTAVLALGLWSTFEVKATDFQLTHFAPWLPELGLNYFVGVDGLGLLLVTTTALIVPVALFASWTEERRSFRSVATGLLVIESAVLGALTSLNLLLFYAFWEFAFLAGVVLVAGNGGIARSIATRLLGFSSASALFLFIGLLLILSLFNETAGSDQLHFNWVPHGESQTAALRDLVLSQTRAGDWMAWVIVSCFGLALALKLPVIPFHAWVGELQSMLPASVSVVFVSVLLKLSAFALLRFLLPLFPETFLAIAPTILALAVGAGLYAALVAMVQVQLMRLVALLSLAHLSFFVLGVFVFNVEGLEGSALYLVNHSLLVAALTLLVGMLSSRRGSGELSAFGGIAKPMPAFAVLFGLTVMGLIGLPGFGGFVAEFLIFLGLVRESLVLAALALSSAALLAIVLVWTAGRVLMGDMEQPENRKLIDLDLREKLLIGALLVPVLWMGLYPETLLRRIHPTVLEVCSVLESKLGASGDISSKWDGCR